MTEQHPITPPQELVQQWIIEGRHQDYCSSTDYAIAKVARWGYEQRGADIEDDLQKARDEELDACCEWLDDYLLAPKGAQLRDARRPKPPSLKEQALQALDQADKGLSESEWQQRSDTIRFNTWDELGIDEIVWRAQRQALARWGNHPGSPDSSLQPVPVSERLPEPEDCNDEGEVWAMRWRRFSLEKDIDNGDFWCLAYHKWLEDEDGGFTHWLPAHALPLPTHD